MPEMKVFVPSDLNSKTGVSLNAELGLSMVMVSD